MFSFCRPARSIAFFLLIVLFGALLITGCRVFNRDSGAGALPLSSDSTFPIPSEQSGPIVFQVIIPPESGRASPSILPFSPSLNINSSDPISVNFELTLINSGNPVTPTSKISQTVLVDLNSGSASANFTGVPACSCIADIRISGGNISGYSEFHGLTDLVANVSNSIILVPCNSGTTEDLSVRLLRRLLSDKEAFIKSPARITGWITLLLSRFEPETPDLFETSYTALTESFSTGFPLGIQSDKVQIVLPAEIALEIGELQLINNVGKHPIGTDGSATLKRMLDPKPGTAPDTAISMAVNRFENPVLINLGPIGNGEVDRIDAVSTAEAVAFFDQTLMSLTPEKKIEARNKIRVHTRFNELVSAVEASLKSDLQNPLDPDSHPEILIISSAISSDVIQQILPGKSLSLRNIAEGIDPIKVTDDHYHKTEDIIVLNETAANYQVSVHKDWQPFKPLYAPLLDSFTLEAPSMFESFAKDFPSLEVSPGDGHISLSICKDTDFTCASALINFLCDIASLPGLSRTKLETFIKREDVKQAAQTLMLLYSQNPDSPKEFALLFLSAVTDFGKPILKLLCLEFYGAAEDGTWALFKYTANFLAKKSPLVMGAQGLYSSGELYWKLKGMFDAPDYFGMTGFQRAGCFPVGRIEKIELVPAEIILAPGEALDLSNVSVKIFYGEVTSELQTKPGEQLVTKVQLPSFTRIHSKAEPAFKNVSKTEWTGSGVEGNIFQAISSTNEEQSEFTVYCTYSEGSGNNAQQSSAHLKITHRELQSPRITRAEGTGVGSFRLEWEPVEGVEGYRVFVGESVWGGYYNHENIAPEAIVYDFGKDITEASISRSDYNMSVECQIRIVSLGKNSYESYNRQDSENVKNVKIISKAPEVFDCRVTNVDHNSITLEWDEINGVASFSLICLEGSDFGFRPDTHETNPPKSLADKLRTVDIYDNFLTGRYWLDGVLWQKNLSYLTIISTGKGFDSKPLTDRRAVFNFDPGVTNQFMLFITGWNAQGEEIQRSSIVSFENLYNITTHPQRVTLENLKIIRDDQCSLNCEFMQEETRCFDYSGNLINYSSQKFTINSPDDVTGECEIYMLDPVNFQKTYSKTASGKFLAGDYYNIYENTHIIGFRHSNGAKSSEGLIQNGNYSYKNFNPLGNTTHLYLADETSIYCEKSYVDYSGVMKLNYSRDRVSVSGSSITFHEKAYTYYNESVHCSERDFQESLDYWKAPWRLNLDGLFNNNLF